MTRMQPFLRLLATGLAAGLLLSVLPACSPRSPASGSAPSVLGAAPTWSLVDLDGKPVGSAELKGKVAVVDFWATWCGPCVHEIPGYVELQKKYADRGLVIVGLSIDEKGEAAVRPFAKRMNIGYPLALATPEVIAAFSATGEIEAIPTTFLIDRDGKIRHRKTGAMDTADYEKLIVPLL